MRCDAVDEASVEFGVLKGLRIALYPLKVVERDTQLWRPPNTRQLKLDAGARNAAAAIALPKFLHTASRQLLSMRG